jgi:chromosome segregation ATPase
MAQETDNLVLDHLKKIQARLSAIEVDLGDLKARTSVMEQYQGQVLTLLGGLNQRMDRFDERLSRIERRLDLVEA